MMAASPKNEQVNELHRLITAACQLNSWQSDLLHQANSLLQHARRDEGARQG